MARLSLIALCVLFAACAAKPVEPTIVRVPVVQLAKPPAELLACGQAKPEWRFYSVPNTKDVVIVEKDQPAFRAWAEDKTRCIRAWQSWTTR